MDNNLSTNVQEILVKSGQLAKNHKNLNIEPEHVLYTIIDSNSPFLKKLNKESKNLILNEMILRFEKFQKSENMPNISSRLTNALSDAQMSQKEVTEIDLLNSIIKMITFSEKPKIEEIIKNIKHSETPTLDAYARELVNECLTIPQDPVIGRVEETRSIIEILSKKKKSNPMLVGPAGVGKTAIVNGLAQLIAKNEAPGLNFYKIYEVEVGSIIANTGVRGQFEERVQKIIKEAENKSIILFIDEIHTVINAGSTSGALDFSNILKPSLAAGKIKIIGATTHDEFRKYIESDAAFSRRFVKVTVSEPTIDDSITMIRGVRNRIESHHGIKIEDNAIVFAVKMAKKYIPARKLPDVGFDLIDTACASATIELESEPQQILNMRNKIWSLELEKAALERDYAIQNKNSEKNSNKKEKQRKGDIDKKISRIDLQIEEFKNSLIPLEQTHAKERANIAEARTLKQKIENVYSRIEDAKRRNETWTVLDLQSDVLPVLQNKLSQIEGTILITANHVANVISRWTGIPITRLTLKENERLMNLAERLKNQVIGQDYAVDQVSECILRSRVGLAQPNRPIGAFLFLGPSGVGKTELTKAIAYELFDDKKSLVFLDMSDYANETSITKLIGVSAGYIGYAEGGSLTEPVKEKPYNVVLFDEIDLAHPKVINILYQLLDEGRVTDGKRNIIDFTNTVIIMTTNLGSDKNYQETEQILINRFGPALINRIDKICYFNLLTEQNLLKILNLNLEDLNLQLQEKKIKLFISDFVKQDIIKKNFNHVYGARPIKRAINNVFVSAITQILLRENEYQNLLVRCYMENENAGGNKIGEYEYVVEHVNDE